MKCIYISNVDPTASLGYDKKIIGQIYGLSKIGVETGLICYEDTRKVVFKEFTSQNYQSKEEEVLSTFNNNLISKRFQLLKNSLKIIKRVQPDFLYLRYPRSDPLYLLFLKIVKKLNHRLIILSEIPTYPYDQEYENSKKIKDKLLFILDKATRHNLKNYIDKVVVVTYEGLVFDIPSINIHNGVMVKQYQLRDNSSVFNNRVNLIGVANVSFWHGYDRVIQGLKQYYESTYQDYQIQVLFHIVGATGEILSQLKTLRDCSGLSNSVTFYQPMSGKELDQLFNQCHVAVGDIGSHRKGLKQTSALKAREYVARGIPFFYSTEDPSFSTDFPYSLKEPADESPINIQNVVDFARKVHQDSEHPVKMREYANRYLDWSVQMEKVVEAIIGLTFG